MANSALDFVMQEIVPRVTALGPRADLPSAQELLRPPIPGLPTTPRENIVLNSALDLIVHQPMRPAMQLGQVFGENAQALAGTLFPHGLQVDNPLLPTAPGWTGAAQDVATNLAFGPVGATLGRAVN